MKLQSIPSRTDSCWDWHATCPILFQCVHFKINIRSCIRNETSRWQYNWDLFNISAISETACITDTCSFWLSEDYLYIECRDSCRNVVHCTYGHLLSRCWCDVAHIYKYFHSTLPAVITLCWKSEIESFNLYLLTKTSSAGSFCTVVCTARSTLVMALRNFPRSFCSTDMAYCASFGSCIYSIGL